MSLLGPTSDEYRIKPSLLALLLLGCSTIIYYRLVTFHRVRRCVRTAGYRDFHKHQCHRRNRNPEQTGKRELENLWLATLPENSSLTMVTNTDQLSHLRDDSSSGLELQDWDDSPSDNSGDSPSGDDMHILSQLIKERESQQQGDTSTDAVSEDCCSSTYSISSSSDSTTNANLSRLKRQRRDSSGSGRTTTDGQVSPTQFRSLSPLPGTRRNVTPKDSGLEISKGSLLDQGAGAARYALAVQSLEVQKWVILT